MAKDFPVCFEKKITSPWKNQNQNKYTKKSAETQWFWSFTYRHSKFEIVFENNFFYAFPKNRLDDYLLITKQFRCLHAGIQLGELKGSDFIPATCVALSKELIKENVVAVAVELDYSTGISFLKKEAIQLPETARGYILVCYKGQALGWVKNVGNRCNNLYPSEWRIRMKIG